ncbi:ribbon-helix-helix domain-containing protein [Methanolobus sp. ZRKC2]|uniref:ribbon-helix-helix domain-containing protein n=1 Tax=Methanolobus sp. ZRKC2 TaxID=3125783 RepID=UPI00324381FD
MAVSMGNKYKIGVTISPYLKERADELIEEKKFSSMSDLVGIALAKFLGEYDQAQKEKAASGRSSIPENGIIHLSESR